MVWPGRSIPPERLPSLRMLASESVFSGLVMPSTRSPGASVVTLAPTAATSPATSRPSCIGTATVDAAVMSGGFAVELVHLADAVLDVPARDRGGEHLDQNVGWPDVRHRMVAVAELVRAAELEQANRFHRVHRSPVFASVSFSKE